MLLGVGALASACFIPRNWRRAPRGAAGRGSPRTSPAPPASASRSRPAPGPRARCRCGSASSSASAAARRRTGRGTAPRAPARAPCRAARGPRSSVPSSRPRSRTSRRRFAQLRQQVVEAAHGPAARAQQVAQRLARTVAPSSTARRAASRAARDVVRRLQRVGPAVTRRRTGRSLTAASPPSVIRKAATSAVTARAPAGPAPTAGDGRERRRAARRRASVRRARRISVAGSAAASLAVDRPAGHLVLGEPAVEVAGPPARTRAPPAASPGDSALSMPSRRISCARPGDRADAAQQLGRGHQVAGLDGRALVEPRHAAPDRSTPPSRARNVSAVARRSRWREHLGLAALLGWPRTRPCRASAGTTAGRSHDPGDGRVLAGERPPAHARRRRPSRPRRWRSARRRRSARRPAGDSRTSRVKRATTSSRWSGTTARGAGHESAASWRISASSSSSRSG